MRRKVNIENVNIEEAIKSLNLEEFNFSNEIIRILYAYNIDKDRLLSLDYFTIQNRYISEENIKEISDELISKGYNNLEITNLSMEQYRLSKMGYSPDTFKTSTRCYMFIRRNGLTVEKVANISYEDLMKIRSVGPTIIKEFVESLNIANIKHSIIIPISSEEIRQRKEKEKEQMINELISLMLKSSNLDIKNNKIDKIIYNDYKTYLNSLTNKKIEDKLNKLKSKI